MKANLLIGLLVLAPLILALFVWLNDDDSGASGAAPGAPMEGWVSKSEEQAELSAPDAYTREASTAAPHESVPDAVAVDPTPESPFPYARAEDLAAQLWTVERGDYERALTLQLRGYLAQLEDETGNAPKFCNNPLYETATYTMALIKTRAGDFIEGGFSDGPIDRDEVRKRSISSPNGEPWAALATIAGSQVFIWSREEFPFLHQAVNTDSIAEDGYYTDLAALEADVIFHANAVLDGR